MLDFVAVHACQYFQVFGGNGLGRIGIAGGVRNWGLSPQALTRALQARASVPAQSMGLRETLMKRKGIGNHVGTKWHRAEKRRIKHIFNS